MNPKERKHNLRDLGEFGWIDKITPGCLNKPDRVIQAIGDDAAVFITPPGKINLVSTDLLVEKVHFDRETTPGFDLGYKALSVNLSDIAAMGGTPENAFVSVGIPKTCPVAYLEGIFQGIKSLAAEVDVNILGGDTTRSVSEIIINIAITGSADENQVLYRHTAETGDLIAATGFLGDSRAGLYVLSNHLPADQSPEKNLVDAHRLPRPFIREGRFLASQKGVNAAIDISDGLSSDLGHIARSSGLGATLYENRLPVSPHLKALCLKHGLNPLPFALHGGEDYVLLFTVSPEFRDRISAAYLKQFGIPLHFLGEMTKKKKIRLKDANGSPSILPPMGWDHFAGDSG